MAGEGCEVGLRAWGGSVRGVGRRGKDWFGGVPGLRSGAVFMMVRGSVRGGLQDGWFRMLRGGACCDAWDFSAMIVMGVT